MEEEHNQRMKELEGEYNVEKQKKDNLEADLAGVKEELENIEARFPQEVAELKDSIEHAKQ